MAKTFLLLGLIVFLAYLFRAVFDRTRVPDVLLLMGLGIVLGPVLGWADADDFGKAGPVLATLALIVILLESGTSLHLTMLGRSLHSTLGLTLLSFFGTMAVVTGVGYWVLNLPMVLALILGGTLGGTSSAVVIPIVQGLKMGNRSATMLVMESALTDVLCIVAVYALLDAQRYGQLELLPMSWSVAQSLGVAVVIGLLGGVCWLLILRTVRRLPVNLFASIAFAMILYGGVEALQFSGAIAVLAFGIALTNRTQLGLGRLGKLPALSATDLGFFREWVFLLKVFFFIYLGLALQLANLGWMLLALGLVLAVYGLRWLIVRHLVARAEPRQEQATMAIMAPKGLAAAVLAGVPLQQGVAEGQVMQDFTFVVVFVSILLTALLLPLVSAQRARGEAAPSQPPVTPPSAD
ncbi:MAG TPA: cation:proton antiporter [Hydrogenophaga sp.]|uniref:cation:proton antiporter n=1 Tax=Hydrogenophaga sp. TaxID=1904254 RepID=UPI002BDC7597|nr:cation:proton antiporter [Hydrogenophaga sp.]HMN93746.1 cation:proton antiporter [Hydrogenophaga sp.]HMP09914.1 cation:proton antiporter [Hydrogenophaga sp.]